MQESLFQHQILPFLPAVCFQGVYFSLYEVEISNKDQSKMDRLVENLKEKDLVSVLKHCCSRSSEDVVIYPFLTENFPSWSRIRPFPSTLGSVVPSVTVTPPHASSH